MVIVGDRPLGVGAYGKVWKARLPRGRSFALKRVDASSTGIHPTTLREVQALRAVSHPNVLNLLAVRATDERTDLWLELCARSLDDHIRTHPPRGAAVRHLARQLCGGVAACHSANVVHRDLKPSNVLIAYCGDAPVVKIADFGLARMTSDGAAMTPEVVTLWYRAPELLDLRGGGPYCGKCVDAWSIGLIVWELFTHAPVLRGESEIQQLLLVRRMLGREGEPSPSLPRGESEEGADFIGALLRYVPSERMCATRALRHRFLRDAVA